MGYRIGTNLAALRTLHRLEHVSDGVARSSARLASGKRIATAADDPAGVAIVTRMEAQERSAAVALRNVQDGLSLAMVAESGAAEINEALLRLRELAIQAGNGTLSPADREALNREVQAQLQAIDQIGPSTTYQGHALLTVAGSLALQVGTGTGTADALSVPTADLSTLTLEIDVMDVGSPTAAREAVRLLDAAIDVVNAHRGSLGATQVRLDSNLRSLSERSVNLAASRSRIQDLDVAREAAEYTRLSLLQQATLGILVRANQQPARTLALLGG